MVVNIFNQKVLCTVSTSAVSLLLFLIKVINPIVDIGVCEFKRGLIGHVRVRDLGVKDDGIIRLGIIRLRVIRL